MDDWIILGVLLLIVGLAVWYVVKAKKSGKKCIGCPYSDSCSKKGDGSACCCGNTDE